MIVGSPDATSISITPFVVKFPVEVKVVKAPVDAEVVQKE